MNQLAMQVVEAAKAAGISRSTLYDEIRRGRLRAIKIGRATRIRFGDLQSWLNSRPAIEPKGGAQCDDDGQRNGPRRRRR